MKQPGNLAEMLETARVGRSQELMYPTRPVRELFVLLKISHVQHSCNQTYY